MHRPIRGSCARKRLLTGGTSSQHAGLDPVPADRGLRGQARIQLLLRSTRHVTFAEIGATYFEHCQPIVDAAETARAALRGQKEKGRSITCKFFSKLVLGMPSAPTP